MRLRFVLLGAALALAASPVAAWGPEGHRVVAELAERRLKPAVRAAIERELREAGEPAPTLPGVATWAYEVRDRASTPLHYVNFPDGGDCHYVPRRDCRGGRCVVAAIEDAIGQLKDRDTPRAQRVIALKNLVHFVGDVHQPLHAGHADDRGGNDVPLRWHGHDSNLHRVWDSGLIDDIDREDADYARRLAAEPLPADAGGGEPPDWAEASCRITQQRGFYPDSSPRREYLERWAPTVDAQLERAGVRLAAVLDRLYD